MVCWVSQVSCVVVGSSPVWWRVPSGVWVVVVRWGCPVVLTVAVLAGAIQ